MAESSDAVWWNGFIAHCQEVTSRYDDTMTATGAQLSETESYWLQNHPGAPNGGSWILNIFEKVEDGMDVTGYEIGEQGQLEVFRHFLPLNKMAQGIQDILNNRHHADKSAQEALGLTVPNAIDRARLVGYANLMMLQELDNE